MAKKVFIGQSLLTFVLETNLNISSGSNPKILFKKPNGVKGFWSATIANDTEIQYDVQTNDLDQAGTWELQAYVEVSGNIGYGERVKTEIEPTLD